MPSTKVLLEAQQRKTWWSLHEESLYNQVGSNGCNLSLLVQNPLQTGINQGTEVVCLWGWHVFAGFAHK